MPWNQTFQKNPESQRFSKISLRSQPRHAMVPKDGETPCPAWRWEGNETLLANGRRNGKTAALCGGEEEGGRVSQDPGGVSCAARPCGTRTGRDTNGLVCVCACGGVCPCVRVCPCACVRVGACVYVFVRARVCVSGWVCGWMCGWWGGERTPNISYMLYYIWL